MPTQFFFKNENATCYDKLDTIKAVNDFATKSFKELPQQISFKVIYQSCPPFILAKDEDLHHMAVDPIQIIILPAHPHLWPQQFQQDQNAQQMFNPQQNPRQDNFPQFQNFEFQPQYQRFGPPQGPQPQSYGCYPQRPGPHYFGMPQNPFSHQNPFKHHRRQMKEQFMRERVQQLVKEEVQKLVPELSKMILDHNNPSQEKEKEKAVHEGYACDGCDVCPIVGARYKCSVQEDFDYCEKCEATKDHQYPFLKIKNPSQKPLSIMVVIDDDAIQQQQQKNNQGNQENRQQYQRQSNPCNFREVIRNFSDFAQRNEFNINSFFQPRENNEERQKRCEERKKRHEERKKNKEERKKNKEEKKKNKEERKQKKEEEKLKKKEFSIESTFQDANNQTPEYSSDAEKDSTSSLIDEKQPQQVSDIESNQQTNNTNNKTSEQGSDFEIVESDKKEPVVEEQVEEVDIVSILFTSENKKTWKGMIEKGQKDELYIEIITKAIWLKETLKGNDQQWNEFFVLYENLSIDDIIKNYLN